MAGILWTAKQHARLSKGGDRHDQRTARALGHRHAVSYWPCQYARPDLRGVRLGRLPHNTAAGPHRLLSISGRAVSRCRHDPSRGPEITQASIEVPSFPATQDRHDTMAIAAITPSAGPIGTFFEYPGQAPTACHSPPAVHGAGLPDRPVRTATGAGHRPHQGMGPHQSLSAPRLPAHRHHSSALAGASPADGRIHTSHRA